VRCIYIYFVVVITSDVLSIVSALLVKTKDIFLDLRVVMLAEPDSSSTLSLYVYEHVHRSHLSRPVLASWLFGVLSWLVRTTRPLRARVISYRQKLLAQCWHACRLAARMCYVMHFFLMCNFCSEYKYSRWVLGVKPFEKTSKISAPNLI